MRERAAGAAFATAGALLAAGVVTHGRPHADVAVRMDAIADHAALWTVSHGLLAAGFVTLAVGAAVFSRCGRVPAPLLWALAGVSIVDAGLHVVEATAVPAAAVHSDLDAFKRWFDIGRDNIVLAMVPFTILLGWVAAHGIWRSDRVPTWAPVVVLGGSAIMLVWAVAMVARFEPLEPLFLAALPTFLAWGYIGTWMMRLPAKPESPTGFGGRS